jgi:PST family polysaccharide transporter
MLAVLVLLGELIRDFGLSQAAIQTARLTHGQATNLFWTNAFVGLMMTCALAFGAPLVARMYGEPTLRAIAPWIAVTFTINALQAQFQVRLVRDLRFVALTVTDVLSQVIGLAGGLVAVLAGAGYWSLVIQMLTVYGSLLMLRVLIARWWPGLPRHEPGMAALYLFGLHSGLAQLVQYAAANLDSFTIGIRWGASALGVYSRAFQMSTVPGNQLLAPLTNVALPFLSRKRHEGIDFYPLLWKAQVALSAAFTYVFVLAGSLAVPLVQIFLGPGWRESATLLSILSIGTAVQVLSYIAFWAFLASSNARQLFFHSLVTKPLLAICILLGLLGGVRGVAWGFTVGLVLSWFISMAWLRRCDKMPVAIFVRSGVYVIGCGLIAGSITWTAVSKLDLGAPVIVLLAGGFVCATGIYVPLLLLSLSTRKLFGEISGPLLGRAKSRYVNRGVERHD